MWLQANITAVYAFEISSSTVDHDGEVESFHVTGTGGGTWSGAQFGLIPGAAAISTWATGQGNSQATVLPTNYNAIDFHLEICCAGNTGFAAYLVGLEVHYTGTAPPAKQQSPDPAAAYPPFATQPDRLFLLMKKIDLMFEESPPSEEATALA